MKGFERLLAPLKRRVINLLVKGAVTLVNDEGDLQVVQAKLLGGIAHDGIEHYQPYGFAFCPKPGALGLFLALGGNRSHTVAAVISDPRYRLKDLEPGEVALYTDEGDVIHFKRGRIIEITAGAQVKVMAPSIELAGNVTIVGTGKLNGQNIAVVP